MKPYLLALVMVGSLLLASPLSAGVAPGNWDKVAALSPGTRIIVTLISGEQIASTFIQMGPVNLMIRDTNGTERSLARTGVQTIVSAAKVRGKKIKGALIGSAVGFGAGFIGLAVVNERKTASGPTWDGEAIGAYAGAGIGTAAIGAVVGAVIGSLHKHQEVFFTAR